MGFYPLMMEMEGREILIVGGGRVALRKYRSLQGLGARFTILAPKIHPDFGLPDERCKQIRKKFCPEDIGAPSFILACTDDREINQEIGRCGREKGIPVNICDAPGDSDFIFPAVAAQGPLKIAVSTGGKCPGLAKRVRDELAEGCAERYSSLAEEAGEERLRALGSPDKLERLKVLQKKIEEG